MGPPFPSKAKKNAVVAVASTERPSVPRVVGICEIDVASLSQVQGSKGHAVRSEHWDGDDLWAWSSNGRPGLEPPESIEGWELYSDESQDLGHKVALLEIEDEGGESGGVPLKEQQPDETPSSSTRNEHVEGEDAEPFERVEEKELSTKGTSCSRSWSRVRLIRRQTSTIYFGRLSCMLYTKLRILIEMTRIMGSNFPCTSHLSFQIWSSHICQS